MLMQQHPIEGSVDRLGEDPLFDRDVPDELQQVSRSLSAASALVAKAMEHALDAERRMCDPGRSGRWPCEFAQPATCKSAHHGSCYSR